MTALGRVEEMANIIAAKDWKTSAHGGVRRTVRESLFRLGYKKEQ
jgi:hypothetical protein